MNRVILLTVLVVLGAGLSASVGAEILEIPGTGACEVLLRDLAAAFNAQNPGAEVRVPPSIGSVGALRRVESGESLMGRVGRAFQEEKKVAGLTYLPFAKDAVILGAGSKVTVRDLTSPQLVAILQGQIANWQELGGENAPIRLLIRQSGDVILNSLRRFLNRDSLAFSPEAKVVHHDLEMVAMIQKYKNSLGMVTRSSIYGRHPEISAMALDHIRPTRDNVNNGQYNLTIEYDLIYKDQLGELAKKFINFIFSTAGQAIVESHGVVPLSKP